MNIKKRKIFLNILILSFLFCNLSFANNNAKDIKEEAIALYETQNYPEAKAMLDSLPADEKDTEIFLLLSNIAQEENNDNLAIQNLNKALDKDYSFYKAYYNLGCIFASKKSYRLASNNFELAIKYNKNFANAYYNLACCQIKLRNFEGAKKNLIKAISLDGKNKDYYYNLAYCYKELNKPKEAQKMLDTYNKLS